jgi:hypothetical protein
VAQLIHVPIDPSDFEGICGVVVCGPTNRWCESDLAVLDRVAERLPLADSIEALGEALPAPAYRVDKEDLALFPRLKQDGSLVVHVVRTVTKVERGCRVFLAERLFEAGPPKSVTLHRPGAAKCELPIQPTADGVQVDLPELDVWSILEFR